MGAAGAFMGGLGQLLGGHSNSDGSTSSSGTSQNQSQNSNVQGSQSTSSNASSSASGSGNQAYGSLSKALDPSLGYVTGAGNMIGALLGLPTSNVNYNVPASSVLPRMPTSSPSAGGGSMSPNLVDQLMSKYLASVAAAPPSTTSTPTPAPTPAPAPVTNTSAGTSVPVSSVHRDAVNTMDRRATGGPVQSGQPVVVGENQPEVFVPKTDGHIIPQVPGAQTHFPTNPGANSLPGMGALGGLNLGDLTGRIPHIGGGGRMHGGPIPGNPAPTPAPIPGTPGPTPTPAPGAPPLNAGSALNNFANSAGQQFVLNEGQRALSGASAANGTFDSGATGKALTQYGQNLGNTYLNDYMNHLFDYAKLGLGSASALSGAGGVSQSVGNSSGGSSSSSIGFGSGSSTGNSNTSSDGTTSSSSKQGLGL